MEITYTWKVTQLTKKKIGDNDNVVLHCRWRCTGKNTTTGTEGSFDGATPLDFDSSSTDEFVQFGDLTEELVIGWIKGIVADEQTGYFDHISESIREEIEETDDPKEELGEQSLPWATGSIDEEPKDEDLIE